MMNRSAVVRCDDRDQTGSVRWTHMSWVYSLYTVNHTLLRQNGCFNIPLCATGLYFGVIRERGQRHWWSNSDKLLKLMNMLHKAGDSVTVPLQYVVGVVAWETWNWFRHTVCSPSWVEWQMAPGSFLQQSIAVQSYHVMKKKFACVEVFDKLCMHRRLHLCTHSRTDFEENLNQRNFFSLPNQLQTQKSIITVASLSVAVGQVRRLQGTSQSTGVHVPSKNRR